MEIILDAGDTYTTSIEIWTAPPELGGTLTNAGTVALTVTQDFDGSVLTPTPVNTSTGKYKYDYLTSAALPGRVTFRWVTTTPSTAHTEEIFVNAADPGLFVSMDEARRHLGASGIITSTTDEEQLRWLCSVACEAIERDLGRTISRRTVVETHDGGQHAIMLRQTPVISVTSVVDLGATLTAGDYVLDSTTGILYRGSTSYAGRFSYGRYSVVVTYVAGYANPPRVVRLAALNLIQSMWQTSQQASHPLLDESSAEAFVGSALPGLSQIPGYNSLRAPAVA